MPLESWGITDITKQEDSLWWAVFNRHGIVRLLHFVFL